MRSYHIPPRTDEKEKIVGGILTLGQVAFVAGGFMLALIVTALLYVAIGPFAVFIGAILACSGFPFAFYKKNNLSLIQNIQRKRKFKRKSKHLINKI